MSSYDADFAALRIFVSDGTEHWMSGCDWDGHYWYRDRRPRGTQPQEWRVRADSSSSEIASVVSEVRAALSLVVEYLDEQYTEDGYVQSLVGRGNDLALLGACIAFGRRDDLGRMLADPSLRTVPTAARRDVDLMRAQLVLDAYRLLDDDPTEEWLEFLTQVVRLFRGRPPKQLRSMWEAVRVEVERRHS